MTALPPTAPTGGYQHPLIISGSCGDTLEADLKKGWLWGSKRQPLGLPILLNSNQRMLRQSKS